MTGVKRTELMFLQNNYLVPLLQELRQRETKGDRIFNSPSAASLKKNGPLVTTQDSFLNPYCGERLKEKMKEGTETSESDASDKEPLPCTSGRRTPSTNRMKFPVSTRLYVLHRSSRVQNVFSKRIIPLSFEVMAMSDNFLYFGGGGSMGLKKDYLSMHILFDKLWCLERKNLPIKCH